MMNVGHNTGHVSELKIIGPLKPNIGFLQGIVGVEDHKTKPNKSSDNVDA